MSEKKYGAHIQPQYPSCDLPMMREYGEMVFTDALGRNGENYNSVLEKNRNIYNAVIERTLHTDEPTVIGGGS